MVERTISSRAAARSVTRLAHALAGALAVLASACVIVSATTITADVLMRNFFASSFRGIIEYNEVLMVALTYLGFAYAERVRAHVAVELVTARLPPRARHLVRVVGLLAVTGPLVWIVVATTKRAARAVEVREYRFGLVEVPIWPARLVIPIGLTAFLLLFAIRLVEEAASGWASWKYPTARADRRV